MKREKKRSLERRFGVKITVDGVFSVVKFDNPDSRLLDESFIGYVPAFIEVEVLDQYDMFLTEDCLYPSTPVNSIATCFHDGSNFDFIRGDVVIMPCGFLFTYSEALEFLDVVSQY